MIKECAYWEDFSYILLFREDTRKGTNRLEQEKKRINKLLYDCRYRSIGF